MLGADASEAWERIAGAPDSALVLCCEHASNRLPAPWRWPAQDEWLLGTHWAHDIGVDALTRELCAATSAPALLARFSRLLIDPNRPLDDPMLIRTVAERRPVVLNEAVGTEERARRIEYWRRYHEALGALCKESSAPVVLAVHSFTGEYEGRRRDDIEVGVLYDLAAELATSLAERIAAPGCKVRLNEPYSGKEGLIYSADRHAREAGKQALEIEVRQDLIVDVAFRAELVRAVGGLEWL